MLGEFSNKLRSHFNITLNFADRDGGQFEFLKKTFVVDPNYERIVICPEMKLMKHVDAAYKTYTQHNGGKPPRLFNAPVNNQLYADDTADPLDEERAGSFRSLVGALLYVSHDRRDIQFAAKSLATDLSNPTTFSWAMLGRLVGYLKKHEKVSMVLTKTRPHNSLFGKLGGAEPDDDSVLLVTTFLEI